MKIAATLVSLCVLVAFISAPIGLGLFALGCCTGVCWRSR